MVVSFVQHADMRQFVGNERVVTCKERGQQEWRRESGTMMRAIRIAKGAGDCCMIETMANAKAFWALMMKRAQVLEKPWRVCV